MNGQPNKRNEDEIGREMLRAAKLSADEIKRITDSPNLFRAIGAEISAEKMRCATERQTAKAAFRFWNLPQIATACVVLIAIGLAAIYFKKPAENQSRENILTAEISAPVDPKVEIVDSETAPAKSAEIFKAKSRNAVKIAPAIFAGEKQIKFAKKFNDVRRMKKTAKPIVREAVFYSLTASGISEETRRNWKVIRVEMNAEMLSTLGVNVASEDQNFKIKTDLLVGADNVPQAIRIVE